MDASIGRAVVDALDNEAVLIQLAERRRCRSRSAISVSSTVALTERDTEERLWLAKNSLILSALIFCCICVSN